MLCCPYFMWLVMRPSYRPILIGGIKTMCIRLFVFIWKYNGFNREKKYSKLFDFVRIMNMTFGSLFDREEKNIYPEIFFVYLIGLFRNRLDWLPFVSNVSSACDKNSRNPHDKVSVTRLDDWKAYRFQKLYTHFFFISLICAVVVSHIAAKVITIKSSSIICLLTRRG